MERLSGRLLNFIRTISVKKRIVISFYITSIIPITILGFFSYSIYFTSVKEKISDITAQSLLLSEMNIKMAIERLESNIIEIAFSNDAQQALNNYFRLTDFEKYTLEQRLQAQSAQQFTLTYFVSDVILFTKNFDTITAYGGRNRRLSLSKDYLSSLVQKVKKAEGKSVFTAVEKNPLNKVILMCRHINDIVTGDRLGYIIIAIDASYFQNICKAGTIGQDSYTLILDNYNTIISSNSKDYLSGDNFQDKKLLDDLFLDTYDHKPFTYVLDYKKYILNYKELIADSWFMVSLIPYTYLNSETRVISYAILVIILACIAGAIVFSEIISKSIDRPLQTTLKLIEKVNKGDLSVGEYDASMDEVAIVNISFNNMIKRLAVSMAEIRTAEKEKLNIEWRALMAQINPHFLANTLNSVKWLAHMQNAENIENLVTALINILQDTLGKEDSITVEREIKSIRDYITIQEYRYFDKFQFMCDVDPESKDLIIPKFILQPLVENAIIHGIAPKKGKGLIYIRSALVNDCLLIAVSDDGVGVPKDHLEKIMDKISTEEKYRFTNIGIKNVHERIQLKFGGSYGLSITSALGTGTTVNITLPVLNKSEVSDV